MKRNEFQTWYANLPVEQRFVPLMSFGWITPYELYQSIKIAEDTIFVAEKQIEIRLKLAGDIASQTKK